MSDIVFAYCPDCHRKVTYCLHQGWSDRSNSSTAPAVCSKCGHRCFFKKPSAAKGDPGSALEQFQTLTHVSELFSKTKEFEVVQPIQFLEGENIIVLEYMCGVGFKLAFSKASREGQVDLLSRAGGWLRQLHSCRPAGPKTGGPVGHLNTLKNRVLEGRYSNKIINGSLALLGDTLGLIDERESRLIWVHGDFTPDNLIIRDSTILGYDIAWDDVSIPELDLAPFLNHLFLARACRYGMMGGKRAAELERAFIEGYFKDQAELESAASLKWYRLYFLVQYWISAHPINGPRGVFNRVILLPQLRKIVSELSLIASLA